MKKFVKLFACFFGLFMLIGMIRGCQARRTLTEYKQLNNVILKNTDLSVDGQQIYLRYQCKGNRMYLYDIDKGLIPVDNRDYQDRGEAYHSLLFEKNQDFILAVLGGISGGYSIKDIIKPTEGVSKWKTVLPAIFGAASGYYVGYWITFRGDPSCDSKEVVALLSKSSEWKQIVRDAWLRLSLDKAVFIKSADGKDGTKPVWTRPANLEVLDDSEKEALAVTARKFQAIADRAKYSDYEFKSDDFTTASSLTKLVAELLAKHPNLYDGSPVVKAELRSITR